MTFRRVVALSLAVIGAVACWPEQAIAQSASAVQAGAPPDDPDLDLVPLQPDFTVIAMPTALYPPRTPWPCGRWPRPCAAWRT